MGLAERGDCTFIGIFGVRSLYEFSKIKQEAINKLETQTDMLIFGVGPALMFEDKEAANKTLESSA